jgi:gas vesicle protein
MQRLVNLIFGALLGGLVGGGVGLLLAPKSGRALRGDISDYADHVKTEVRRATDQRRVELERELAEMREPMRSSE